MSSEVNPAHVDEECARSDSHGIVATACGAHPSSPRCSAPGCPGPATIYLEQTLCFRHPITIGDTISVSVAVTSKNQTRHRVVLDCRCVNQRGETFIDGTAKVLALTEKVRRPWFVLPEVSLRERGASSG
jgi:acyl dehydratase